MSPLALYIEQVYDHDAVSPGSDPKVFLYPPSPPDNRIFDSVRSAPILTNTEMNRVLIYPGSFNPPHRGHLHLLKHVFTRGTHDLNVIAAIILPRSDESVCKKVNDEQGLFRFGRAERCFLWKQDVCFPPWAWVYEKSTTSFPAFLDRLAQETQKDGYSIEFVNLYGAGVASPEYPPRPPYGCKTIIMSDVARAANFERSSGRIKDFEGFTKWRRISVNEAELRRRTKTKVNNAMMDIKVCPPEICRILKDGMYGITLLHLDESRLRRPVIGPAYVENTTESVVIQAIKDLKEVLTCQQTRYGQTLTLRFVSMKHAIYVKVGKKYVKSGKKATSRKKFNDISSSEIRKIMHKKDGAKLKAALDWMALSAEVLWVYQNLWIDEARLGTGSLVKFLDFTEEFVLSEGSSSDAETTPSEIPPSLEDLGLAKMDKKSQSISKQPQTSSSAILKALSRKKPPANPSEKPEPQSPTGLEPQPLDETQDPNDRKQRSSETGLEAVEKSPSITEEPPISHSSKSKPPYLTDPNSRNPSPSSDESEPEPPSDHQPQPPPEHQNPNGRKRRFSQTGLEAEREVLDA